MTLNLFTAGLVSPPAVPPPLDTPRRSRTATFADYHLNAELAAAVNVACHLHRPLLVTGEPGTGKTALAWAIARRLGAGDVLEYHCRSNSQARDLLYQVDHLRRFHDAQCGDARAQDAANYITYAALGEAIRSPRTRVVLVDEVDKAPRDFPNDLLDVFDRMRFSVPEMGPDAVFEARVDPVVVLTSNSERRLPPAFLRRCIYAHIAFPGAAQLSEIVRTQTADLAEAQGLREAAVRRFLDLRAVEGLSKKPATDELIAWVRVLHAMGVSEAGLLGCALTGLPAREVLLKLKDDADVLERRG